MDQEKEVIDKSLAISKIAIEILRIKNLDSQNSDTLDFHDLSVTSIRIALTAAYDAGYKNGSNNQKN
jgi:hypothetical protein